MSDNTVTAIAHFGQKSAEDSSLIVAEVDGQKHLDDEGNERSVFLPGEDVYFLLHHAPEIKIVRVRATDGGDVQRIGLVSRTRTQQISFDHPDHAVDLSYMPSGALWAKWYGKTASLLLSGRTVRVENAPCLGDITYPILATQYVHRPTNGLILHPGEAFPVDLKIEHTVG